MSSMGELTFFLGLYVTQKDDGIFISQDKYVDEILKKFGFSTMKTASTPMETSKPLLNDENAKDIDVHLYRLMISSLMYLTSLRPDIMFAGQSFGTVLFAIKPFENQSRYGRCKHQSISTLIVLIHETAPPQHVRRYSKLFGTWREEYLLES
ncbi:uncharacterized mitochondrial protein-like protein [Tanacetum coccineum]